MKTPISFEFFPPKSESGIKSLDAAIAEFKSLKPEYMSVTFGAGGSTQDGTLNTVLRVEEADITACPHISCIGMDKTHIKDLLSKYKSHGIDQLVVIRGDLPSGNRDFGELVYANQLVELIRDSFGDFFKILVAAYPETHPQAKNFYEDFTNFKNKIAAGADEAITQFFYNPDAYYAFIDECAKQGVNIPIVPGILPINNYVQLSRFSNACGAEIPRWIATRLESFGDDLDSIRSFGVDVVSKLCDDLLTNGAPALHFYCMNKVEPSLEIIKRLG